MASAATTAATARSARLALGSFRARSCPQLSFGSAHIRRYFSSTVTRAQDANNNSGGGGGGGQAKQQQQGRKKKQDDSPYSATVLLPKTDFSMRANAKTREPELQKWWREERVYEELVRANRERGGATYTLHDGPPYANGTLHLGHALNKVLKDIIVKHRLLKGDSAAFIPGWDCHGLPIELKVLQSLNSKTRKALTPMTMRAKARDFALKTIEEQAEQFRRYGVWGDWQNR